MHGREVNDETAVHSTGRNTMQRLKNILVVMKTTAYEQYLARKEAGEVFPVRWERLKKRHECHKKTVDVFQEYVTKRGISWQVVERDHVTPEDVSSSDMVVSIGGDGTALMAAMSITGSTPLLGINSDPTRKGDEVQTWYKSREKQDSRRSTGHLCACGPENMEGYIDKILDGSLQPTPLARIKTEILSAEGGTRIVLPPVLNDVLLSHPCPGAVSRYSIRVDAEWWFHVRSSGIRVCTATGATAAMRSAGGAPMHPLSREMQFQDREPIYHDHTPPPSWGRGFYSEEDTMHIRWSSRAGTLYLDGAHVQHDVALGQEVFFSTQGPRLQLFRAPHMDVLWEQGMHKLWGDTNDTTSGSSGRGSSGSGGAARGGQRGG